MLHLPASRAEMYFHAILRKHGWRTFAPLLAAETQREALASAPAPAWQLPPELGTLQSQFDKLG